MKVMSGMLIALSLSLPADAAERRLQTLIYPRGGYAVLPLNGQRVETIEVASTETDQIVVVTTPGAGKKSFAERHPVARRRLRRVRRWCAAWKPVIEFAGAVAQIVTAVKR